MKKNCVAALIILRLLSSCVFAEVIYKGSEISQKAINLYYEDEEKALLLLQQGANSGDMDCIAHLGSCYITGDVAGTEQDIAKAFDLLNKAADHNNPIAYYYLAGVFLEYGYPKDAEKGLGYLRKSMEQNYLPSYRTMGVMLENDGKYQEAAEAYKKVIEFGDKDDFETHAAKYAYDELIKQGHIMPPTNF